MPNRFDIFLSYRWPGDIAFEAGGRGWAAALRNLLQTRLRECLGREPRIFIDLDEMERNLPLHEALRGALESSTLLIAVITEASAQSDSWGRWEIGHFANCASPCVGSPARRMFKAVLLPVGRELEPESLADHPAYQFFYRMGRDGNGSPHPCPIEHLTNPAMPVSREFDRLATDLCRRLKEIEEQPCSGVAARSVYVARSTLRAHHARLCEELHNKGYRVVSEAPWPGSTSEEFSQRVASRLVEASASIHLWAGGSVRTPEAHAVSDVELSAALDVAGRPDKTRFRVYYWDTAGTAAWDGARRLTASPAVVNFAGKDWEFSLSNIFLSLAQRAAEPADSGPEPENAECTHRVFLHCLEEDRAHAAAIREHFLRRRIWLWFLPQPLSFWIRKRRSPIDQEVASQHESWCRESHGALVLLNNGPEIWANARCREIEAANGRSRGVAVVPPEDLRKKSFGYPAFTKYWTPELDRYIDRLIGRDGK